MRNFILINEFERRYMRLQPVLIVRQTRVNAIISRYPASHAPCHNPDDEGATVIRECRKWTSTEPLTRISTAALETGTYFAISNFPGVT